MKLTMSNSAQRDGAWGTILNRLKGFTFEVTKTDQSYFVGRVIMADETTAAFAVGRKDAEVEVFIDDIEEMEYL